jgi:ApbE superfamily uncharacterized protein (UPF0280 family)
MPSTNDGIDAAGTYAGIDAARTYRHLFAGSLKYFRVAEEQSDLAVGAYARLEGAAREALREARRRIKAEIAMDPGFLTSFAPLAPRAEAPEPVSSMYLAAQAAQVGPMAAVAGAVARHVGRSLLVRSPEVIVENGGDIYIATKSERLVAIFAGDSPLSMKVALKVPPGEWGVCTSAGRVGPSVSYGQADAAVILSKDAALADAAATALGNALKTGGDIPAALSLAMAIPGVLGAVAVVGDRLGAAGQVELAPYNIEED